jgi:hypothetical protein
VIFGHVDRSVTLNPSQTSRVKNIIKVKFVQITQYCYYQIHLFRMKDKFGRHLEMYSES